ncbi:DUF192 domain-containing protein [Rhodoferax sp.]|uniref:DUF192 domain-containing protein n=1 Tax=Rhodoferax sp. TaxID=50421 RepID=UPI000ABA605A|nr:DUF192 domain-containing protein [Rhodoferax sp.]MDO8317837.1 DUF192 domain-containing protein [Rhodoferax sp.]MDO9611448.1 DUF192 domain-containing protein [Serpentinimonas sp.]
MFKPFAWIFSAAALRFLALCGLALGLASAAYALQPLGPPLQQQPQALPPQGAPQLDLPRLQLQAGLHLIAVQVASTPAQRNTGLMWRRSMPPNEGMLFVFDTPAIQCFWMKNTFLPLTAAFVAEDGRIVNLVDMQPLSERSHCSAEPVRFVLEMHQGWFAQRGIEAGQRLRGAPFAADPVR